MATTTYYSTIEIDKDHTRICTSCNRPYNIVLRSYPAASSRTAGTSNRAHNRAAADAQSSAVYTALSPLHDPARLFWHRCTHCGLYPQEDIEKMKGTFAGFIRERRVWATIISIFAAVPILAFVFSIPEYLAKPMAPLEIALSSTIPLALTLVGGLFAWCMARRLPQRFEALIADVNNPA